MKLQHIDILEIKAVLLAITHFKTSTRQDSSFVNRQHNSCVLSCSPRGNLISESVPVNVGHSPSLLLFEGNFASFHIPSKFNVTADRLSCSRPLQTEWSLQQTVFQNLLHLCPSLSVDLFPTKANHKLDLYVSPFPDCQAIGVDALSIPWKFPGVFQKIRTSQVMILVIAPCWPKQSWDRRSDGTLIWKRQYL